MGTRTPQSRVDDVLTIRARALERSLALLAEAYAIVAKLRHATATREPGRPPGAALAVLDLFESLRALFEPNAIRLDSATCESIEALLAFRAAFDPDEGPHEPETGAAFGRQVADTKRHLEDHFRAQVGIK